MDKKTDIRWGWIRLMYIYTFLGAGGFGLGILFAPDFIQSLLRFPGQDPVVFGIVGSVYTGFGLMALMGLRAPLKFLPILLLQLCYKTVWLLVVIAPLFLSGQRPLYAVILLAIFATYIIGDLIAIPFSFVISKHEDP